MIMKSNGKESSISPIVLQLYPWAKSWKCQSRNLQKRYEYADAGNAVDTRVGHDQRLMDKDWRTTKTTNSYGVRNQSLASPQASYLRLDLVKMDGMTELSSIWMNRSTWYWFLELGIDSDRMERLVSRTGSWETRH